MGPEVATAAAAEDESAKEALVELEIHRDGAVMAHPGSVAKDGEDLVFTVDKDGKRHEVKVRFVSSGEDAFNVSLTYKAGGKKLVSGKAKAAAKDWAAVASKDGKTRVQVRINPSYGKIEIQPTDDPIGGLE